MTGSRKRQIAELKVRDHCDMLLEALVGKDLVDKWWSSPNHAFDGKTPREAELSLVHSYLLSHAYCGGWS